MGVKSNYSNNLYKDYELLSDEYEKLKNEYEALRIRVMIAEDNEKRLQKIVDNFSQIIKDKYEQRIIDLEQSNAQLQDKNATLQKENERLRLREKLDGTNSGIPTSQTPVNKKKVIPNFAKKTGEKIGRKPGHKKDKLERLSDDKINEHIEHTLEVCPNCKKEELIPTGNIISKDVIDYKIVTSNKRHDYIEYKCSCCGKVVHELIPNHLKEECQYGTNVKSLALSLTNIGNVPFNKTRRIIRGLTLDNINPSEGYLAKLQKTASKKLTNFVEELHKAARGAKKIYWDDTTIMVSTKQSCMRFYGNTDFCLYKAHERKNKESLDKDNILKCLSPHTAVVHDHNRVNYNSDYSFINVECCQHLLRDLRKVEINLPSRVWCKDLISLFQEYDHKRNELITKNIDSFSDMEINIFIQQLDEDILKGYEENEKDSSPYYADNERALLNRIIQYRDNYIYWIFDFDIPFTNNLSERNLRGIKSKIKVSGQFQNIERAVDYANIKSYIETCRLYGKNEYNCLSRLIEGNPYTYQELTSLNK